MIGLYRAILSVDDFKPIGYMIIECKNSYFSEKLQSVPSTYKNRFYLLNNDMDIIVSSEKNMCGNSFPLETRDFKNVKIVKDPSTGENSYFTYQYVNNGWLLVSTINVGQLWKSIGIALVSVLITFGIVLLVSLIIMRYAARVMVKPTKKLVDSMTAYQEGNFDSRFKVESQDEISQIGMVYNQMADKVQNLIEKNYTLEIANREAEIEFLKMQINPHFLYNCLDTISWLGFSNGNSEITDLAVALGKFLRASIKREDYYTVKQEMEVVDNYLFIQKYRFGDKIEIRHNIPDEVLNFYMPSFIIQPVIENSIVRVKLLKEYVEQGGTLVIGCRSGYKDMNGKCVMLPQPGLLAELTGTDVRDFTFTSPAEDEVFAEFSDKKIPMPVFNDIITPLEGTKTLAIYGNSYYEGNPALTCHAVGKGQVLHLGATFNKENTEALFDYLKIKEPFKEYIEAPETAEVIMREKDGEKYIFVLNYQAEKIEYTLQKPMIALYDKTEATGRCTLPAFGTAVYKVIE